MNDEAHSKIAKDLGQAAGVTRCPDAIGASRARMAAAASVALAVGGGMVAAAMAIHSIDAGTVAASLTAAFSTGSAVVVPDMLRPRRRLPRSTGSAFGETANKVDEAVAARAETIRVPGSDSSRHSVKLA